MGIRFLSIKNVENVNYLISCEVSRSFVPDYSFTQFVRAICSTKLRLNLSLTEYFTAIPHVGSTAEKWKIRRRLITPTFHFKILNSFIQVLQEQSETLVAQLQVSGLFLLQRKHFVTFYNSTILFIVKKRAMLLVTEIAGQLFFDKARPVSVTTRRLVLKKTVFLRGRVR